MDQLQEECGRPGRALRRGLLRPGGAGQRQGQGEGRKGGTAKLVGTQILTGLTPIGEGKFRGRAFVPKRNIHATATVRQLSDDVMQVQGCVFGGLLCDSEKWTRVTS